MNYKFIPLELRGEEVLAKIVDIQLSTVLVKAYLNKIKRDIEFPISFFGCISRFDIGVHYKFKLIEEDSKQVFSLSRINDSDAETIDKFNDLAYGKFKCDFKVGDLITTWHNDGVYKITRFVRRFVETREEAKERKMKVGDELSPMVYYRSIAQIFEGNPEKSCDICYCKKVDI